jgi:hypothetical protein
MDKLHSLMVMVFKYQVIHCVSLRDIIDITLNHLKILQKMVADSALLCNSLEKYTERVSAIYADMSLADLCAVRQSLCTFFQDQKEKISLLLEQDLQSRKNGTIIAPAGGHMPEANHSLGTVRYFSRGEEVKAEWLPVVTASAWKLGSADSTHLGQNMYSKVWSVKHRKESERSNVGVSNEILPSHWTNKLHDEEMFEQLVYVSRDHHDKFGELLQKTYLPISTQDRPCPTRIHPREPGGCICVRPGGNPGLPTGYSVRRIIRVENSGRWARYMATRDSIMQRRSQAEFWKFKPQVMTSKTTGKYPEIFGQLNEDYNEVYLWHGTPVRTALSIAHEDFNINLAGTTHGSMYGRGLYLAESCTKADEYAKDEPGYYKGMFALLLCRVCMGKFFRTIAKDEQAGDRISSGAFDSTLGDRSVSVGTFREFVIYDADQLYPEFVIIYSRQHKASTEEELRLANIPFHLELPPYWANCYNDPRTHSFNDQFLLEKSTLTLLEKFVQACTNEKINIISAKRIENSTSWNRYVDFKAALHKDADWGKRKIDLVQDVRTTEYLKKQFAEEAVSFENIDENINEFLLWHGTTGVSAETIAADFFSVSAGDVAHGARFGVGAYFAEDLDKSLTYTKGKETLVRHVLLCRVCCGDVYRTEMFVDPLAHQKARAKGKTCVLANPGGRGHREFVVLSEVQVYPEYMLELNAKFSL